MTMIPRGAATRDTRRAVRRCAWFPAVLAAVVLAGAVAGAPLLQAAQGECGAEPEFEFDWRFRRGDAPGAESPTFDDANWRRVNLPHDWSIEDLPPLALAAPGAAGSARVVSGPFDSAAPGGLNSGFTIGGTGWYRKHFAVPARPPGTRVIVEFDGVYMNPEFWINGHRLGAHPYGYTPVVFDLTPYLREAGGDNVLAVCVRNEGVNSRWYAGSGIYRHVRLRTVPSVHLAFAGGVKVTTAEATATRAVVHVQITIDNETGRRAEVKLVTAILDPDGRRVASHALETRVSGETPTTIDETFEVPDPRLWSPEQTALHRVVSELSASGGAVDRRETLTGFRSIAFGPEGFRLNGRKLKLKGAIVHENNGPLGAAAFDRAEERRVELLQAAGFNAVRCAHNPPAPAFLEACDRLGLMVIDEAFDAWTVSHPPITDDYHQFFAAWWQHDLGGMIRRDWNHPSVILWSIGNQIRNHADDAGVRTAQELAAFTRALDPSRPVTSNVFAWGRDWRDADPFFAALDVAGYSYARPQYDTDHQRLPNRVILSSEIDPANAFENWMAVVDRDFVCGNFEWTTFDYMGEAGLGWWSYGHSAAELFPWHVSYSGDFDLCGFRRPRSHYRDALWSDRPVVAAFVHPPRPSFAGPGKSAWGWDDVRESWTWTGLEGREMTVDVYSNCEQVRLTLNGRDLGAKPVSRATQFRGTWPVPYAAGTLAAIGYRGGREVARWELRSAGRPAAIRLTPDRRTLRAVGQDLSYVTIEIVDATGNRCPDTALPVEFAVEGAGTLAGVGNSRPDSLESFQQPRRTSFEGRCLAIIRTDRQPGPIRLTARVAGLPDAEVELAAVAVDS